MKIRSSAEGFTLIELMVTISIIGVLATIAIPNFENYVLKTRAKRTVVETVAMGTFIQGIYATTGSYPVPSSGGCMTKAYTPSAAAYFSTCDLTRSATDPELASIYDNLPPLASYSNVSNTSFPPIYGYWSDGARFKFISVFQLGDGFGYFPVPLQYLTPWNAGVACAGGVLTGTPGVIWTWGVWSYGDVCWGP